MRNNAPAILRGSRAHSCFSCARLRLSFFFGRPSFRLPNLGKCMYQGVGTDRFLRDWRAALLWFGSAGFCAITFAASGPQAARGGVAPGHVVPAIDAVNSTQPVSVQSMHLLDADSGWAATTNTLLWTQDDGSHWRDITPPSLADGSLQNVFFLDEQHAWVASSGTPARAGGVAALRHGSCCRKDDESFAIALS